MNPLGKPSLGSLLTEFWSRHAAGEDALALLRLWAEQQPLLRTIRSPQAVRREHTQQRAKTRWRRRICFVCVTRFATQAHHIVQVQYGGTNRRDNKVWVCNDCHALIHPHLAARPADAPVGSVPYQAGTEQLSTCPGCRRPVLTVKPVMKRRKLILTHSSRPIMLQLDAQPPYRTTDLHQPVCGQKRALAQVVSADLYQMAKADMRFVDRNFGYRNNG